MKNDTRLTLRASGVIGHPDVDLIADVLAESLRNKEK
jgi:hypothetical protein